MINLNEVDASYICSPFTAHELASPRHGQATRQFAARFRNENRLCHVKSRSTPIFFQAGSQLK